MWNKMLLNVSLFFFLCASLAAAKPMKTTWGGTAEQVYNSGFVQTLMKHPSGGVCLFNRTLIENDSPGVGVSEKGPNLDAVWGKNRGRKIFTLEDPRAFSAWIVIMPAYGKPLKQPLKFFINGHKTEYDHPETRQTIDYYRWLEFPAKWLQKGKNTIDFACPDAKTEDEGWLIFTPRADDFAQGGGDPSNVGETSWKSFDDGKTWRKSPFGPNGKTRAEYALRLSLDRYEQSGWLASPVIDLWKGDSQDFIVPLREIRKMKLAIRAENPEGTKIEYFFRRGTNPQPFSTEWEPYRAVGSGPSLDFETGGADLNRRYVQFKAVLSTSNPLLSPIIKSASVTAELEERVPLYPNIRVVKQENLAIKYSSIDFAWESWDRPEFRELRKRENLDEVVAGSRTEFDAQVKLLNYVTKRWYQSDAFPGYPAWDGLSILDRIDSAGAGGYCTQFNLLLSAMFQSYGWEARQVNGGGHAIMEVWNDEFGKWIFMDAYTFGNCYDYDRETAEPQSLLELHNKFLDYYFPDRPIEWGKDSAFEYKLIEGKEPPVKRGSASNYRGAKLTGFLNGVFVRFVARNNWFEQPLPRPVTDGSSMDWPLTGFVNWYDAKTPPKRHYRWHTARPRDMWPDLNKVHVDATQGFGNDRLFLLFETYTPNFSHFEVNADDTGWKQVRERWTWLLQSGKNTLLVRAVNKLGAKGKPSVFVVNHADAPFGE
jgi:hypothetical protein